MRPAVGIRASVLLGALGSDALLVAAWRDLVAACRRLDHTRFPADRIAFLRDTLVGLIKYRNQDLHHWSPISTAVSVLHGGGGQRRAGTRNGWRCCSGTRHEPAD